MGWVTLSLRKKELQRTHSDLQVQDLQLSREQRALARNKMYENTLIQNRKASETDDLRSSQRRDTASIYDEIKNKRDQKKGLDPNSQQALDLQDEIDELNEQRRAIQEDSTAAINDAASYYDNEFAMLEQESADREAMIEDQKVAVETEMEAVAAELQAVKEAVSQEIQNSVISLK